MLSPRLVMPVCFGFAIAGAVTAYRIFGHAPRAGAALLCLCVSWFCAREGFVGYCYAQQRKSFRQLEASLQNAAAHTGSEAVIAIPDPLLALPREPYTPPALRARLVFPIDFMAVRRYRHDDSPEQNLWAARQWLSSLRIVSLGDFQHTAGDYLIVAADGNWLLRYLADHHFPVTRLPIAVEAKDIGGFTPLAHGCPAMFLARGDAWKRNDMTDQGRTSPYGAKRLCRR